MSRRERQRRQAHRRGHPVKRVLLMGSMLTLCAIVLAAAGVVGWVLNVAASSPNIDQLKPRVPGQVSVVYAANGTQLGYLSSAVLRSVVPQAQQPQLLRNATVAIEDRRFWHHGGVDYYAVVRAAVRDELGASTGVQGGSTLTMQLVKNVYLPDKLVDQDNLRYKIIQAKLANQLEDRRSKAWILTQYLNDVEYGTVNHQNAIGVGAASEMFFNKPVQKLDLAQYALLAGMPQAPSEYNPFTAPGLARARRAEVLKAMLAAGYITAEQEAAAAASPLQVRHSTTYQDVNQPYVFDYVRQQLIAKLGAKTVDRGGLKVYTTINLQDQAYAKEALEENEGQPGDPDAAIATVNPANGEIVAMAQNTNYGTGAGETTFNYATQALRQTGSAFKTFSLMTLIHDYNGDPNTTYYTSKFLAAGWLPPPFQTYSVATAEDSYQGVINITKATTLSDNTVYAQLGVDLGVPKVLATAYAMGVTTHQDPYPAAIIGGLSKGVTPMQMSDAYATLANGGTHYTPTIIAKVVLPSGKTLNLTDQQPNRVFSDGEAYAGTQVLKTVLTQGTGTGAYYDCPAAGKTGTTNNYTDAWFVGYSPNLSTAVWVGYKDEDQYMEDVNGLGAGYGGTLAAPIWKDFMEKAEDGYCSDFPQPAVPWTGTPYFGKHSASGSAANTYTGPYTVSGTTTTPLTVTGADTVTTPVTGVTGVGTETTTGTGDTGGTGASGAGTGATGAGTGATGNTQQPPAAPGQTGGTGAGGGTGPGATTK